jgi:hypothetical protein
MRSTFLGLQGGRANGGEPTFDGQPMQEGMHLRWAFTPQFGFPPGAFLLYRRPAQSGTGSFSPPQEALQSESPVVATSNAFPFAEHSTATTISVDACCQLPRIDSEPPCTSLSIAGRVMDCTARLLIWTYGFDAEGEYRLTGCHELVTRSDAYRFRIEGEAIAVVLIEGAASIDEARGRSGGANDASVAGAGRDPSLP